MFPSLVFVQLEQVRTRDTALIEDQSKARIKANQSDSFHLSNDKVKGNKWHVTICSSSHELLKMIRRSVKDEWHYELKWTFRKKWMHYIRNRSWTEDKLRVVSPYFRLLNSDPSLISSAAVAAAAGALPNLLLINFINIEYARIGIRSTQCQCEKINLRSVWIWFTWTSNENERKEKEKSFFSQRYLFITKQMHLIIIDWKDDSNDSTMIKDISSKIRQCLCKFHSNVSCVNDVVHRLGSFRTKINQWVWRSRWRKRSKKRTSYTRIIFLKIFNRLISSWPLWISRTRINNRQWCIFFFPSTMFTQ